MASARFRIGRSNTGVSGTWTWGAYGAAVDVDPFDFIKIELESTAGVATINATITRADETAMAGTLPVVKLNQATRTATFRVGGVAATYCVDVTTNPSSSDAEVASLAVHIPLDNGSRLIALGETTEADVTYRWLSKINDAIRNADFVATTQTMQTTTTNGSASIAMLIPIAESSAATVLLHVTATTDTGDCASWFSRVVVSRTNSDMVAIKSALADVIAAYSTHGWSISASTLESHPEELIVCVTGAAGTIVQWKLRAEVDAISAV